MQKKIKICTQETSSIYGLEMPSNDRSLARDIPALSDRLCKALGKEPGTLLPYYVVTRDYNPETKASGLFIGTEQKNVQLADRQDAGLSVFCLPAGTYARITIYPWLGFLWGIAIGSAKRYFYTKWLPGSEYAPLSLEYELHTEESLGDGPSIDLLFAIRPKDTAG